MIDREQMARVALRDLERVQLKELLGMRERNSGAVQIWRSKTKPQVALVQMRLRRDWALRLIPPAEPGRSVKYPWKDDVHDKVVVHKIERLLCENGAPYELVRLNIGGAAVIDEAWRHGFLREVRR